MEKFQFEKVVITGKKDFIIEIFVDRDVLIKYHVKSDKLIHGYSYKTLETSVEDFITDLESMFPNISNLGLKSEFTKFIVNYEPSVDLSLENNSEEGIIEYLIDEEDFNYNKLIDSIIQKFKKKLSKIEIYPRVNDEEKMDISNEFNLNSTERFKRKIELLKCGEIEILKNQLLSELKNLEEENEEEFDIDNDDYIKLLYELSVYSNYCKISIFNDIFNLYKNQINNYKKMLNEKTVLQSNLKKRKIEYDSFDFSNFEIPIEAIEYSDQNDEYDNYALVEMLNKKIANNYCGFFGSHTIFESSNLTEDIENAKKLDKNLHFNLIKTYLNIEKMVKNFSLKLKARLKEFSKSNCNVMVMQVSFYDGDLEKEREDYHANMLIIEKVNQGGNMIAYISLFDPNGFSGITFGKSQNEFVEFLTSNLSANIAIINNIPDEFCPNIQRMEGYSFFAMKMKEHGLTVNMDGNCYWWSYFMIYKMLTLRYDNQDRYMIFSVYVKTNPVKIIQEFADFIIEWKTKSLQIRRLKSQDSREYRRVKRKREWIA